MIIRQIVDPKLAQYAYFLGCQQTGEAIVVDPMRDVQQYFDLAAKEGLRLVAAAETHIHADFVSGLRELAEQGLKVYASDNGGNDWRYEWLIDSPYTYQLLKHNDEFRVGNIGFRAIHTPGHTPEHLTYAVTDFGGGASVPMGLITGDFVFVGDVGRPDLLETAAGVADAMEPSARQLYRSILEFKKLPEFYQVWPGHGAGSACGKSLGAVPHTTVGYELRFNAALREAEDEERFVHYILEGQPEPPIYFERMKRWNKMGPPVLGKLTAPRRLAGREVLRLVEETSVAVLDTRPREQFLKGHISRSLLSPWNKQFNTIAGCYIDEAMPVCLLIEEEHVAEAVRDLINVGLDSIVGWAPPNMLEEYRSLGGKMEKIEWVRFENVGDELFKKGVLDVRSASEHAELAIPGSLNIAHTRLAERLGDIPRGERLYVHCATGSRAAPASAFLKRHGIDVVCVDGEFVRWMKKQEMGSG
jgi:hydroxyacylglutathione hydrolase